MGIVNPDRAPLLERNESELLPKARYKVQTRREVIAEIGVIGSRTIEDQRRGHVHVGAVPLEVEE